MDNDQDNNEDVSQQQDEGQQGQDEEQQDQQPVEPSAPPTDDVAAKPAPADVGNQVAEGREQGAAAQEGGVEQEEEEVAKPVQHEAPTATGGPYAYDDLKQGREWPSDVISTQREQYLSDEEFQQVFQMSKSEFNKLPKWRQVEKKKPVMLF